jgi:hypothetical protein
MTLEQKRALSEVLVPCCMYAVYLVITLGRADGGTPLAEVPYVATLLWTTGVSIVVSIVIHIVATIATPAEDRRVDDRDREITRFGEHVGQSFLVLGALSGMVMAMFEVSHFWIANALYLGFTLSAVLGGAAKLAAYRKGFQPW